ncbi:MAG: hypothetical protein IJ911_14350 [Salinivirgaceae bacterium]|nr:hypothetical protein [Salinivirgaceae bacterium]
METLISGRKTKKRPVSMAVSAKNAKASRESKREGVEIKRELTNDEERAAFLYTSKINASRAFAKYL